LLSSEVDHPPYPTTRLVLLHPPSTLARRAAESKTKMKALKAILTDIQFWTPVIVLAMGILLLAYLGNQ
jgi:hypothetical protein